MKKVLLILACGLALSTLAFSQTNPATDLPYRCTAKEKGKTQEFQGKSSSREDWARTSALEICRKAAGNPGKCAITHCSGPSHNDPDPTPNPTDPNHCENSIQCNGFDICVNGRCIDRHDSDNRCSTNLDCGFPEQCLNGKCLGSNDPQCSNNSDCSGFQICVGQKCVDSNSGDNRCNSDFDCGFPSHCDNGQCTR